MIRLGLGSLVILLGSCHLGVSDIPSVPDNPTFETDVKPLLAQHCLMCHGSPPDRGAPGGFRLDVYNDVGRVKGAKSKAKDFIGQVNDDSMPPSGLWGDGVGTNGKALLKKWLANGTPP